VTSLGNAINGITIDGEDGDLYSYAGTVIRGNTIEFNREYGVRDHRASPPTPARMRSSSSTTDILNNGFGLLPAAPADDRRRADRRQREHPDHQQLPSDDNGEDVAGNGIDIVNGSHGTIVFSNDIHRQLPTMAFTSRTPRPLANPVRIGDVLVRSTVRVPQRRRHC